MNEKRQIGWFKFAFIFVFTFLTLLSASYLIPFLSDGPFRNVGSRLPTGNISNAKRLGVAFLMYANDHDQRLPFPGDYRGGKLGRAGSPAWVIAGRSEINGGNSPRCEIPGSVDFCSMADPETGSIWPYGKDRLETYRTFPPKNEPVEHILGPRVDERRFLCGFSMNAALGPLVLSETSIRPFAIDEVELQAERILLAAESPRTATGGRFHPGPTSDDFPISELKDLQDGKSVVSYLDGHAKTVRVLDYAYGEGPKWMEFGWYQRLKP